MSDRASDVKSIISQLKTTKIESKTCQNGLKMKKARGRADGPFLYEYRGGL